MSLICCPGACSAGWLDGWPAGWLAGWQAPSGPRPERQIGPKACTCRISKQWGCFKARPCAFSPITGCTGTTFEACYVPQSIAGTLFEATAALLKGRFLSLVRGVLTFSTPHVPQSIAGTLFEATAALLKGRFLSLVRGAFTFSTPRWKIKLQRAMHKCEQSSHEMP